MKTKINIEVQWDTQNPASHGWAYYTYRIEQGGDATGSLRASGPIDGRQSSKVRPSRARVLKSAGVSGGRHVHVSYR